MTMSVARLAGLAVSAAALALALWQWGFARTALQLLIVSAVLALLGRLQRKQGDEHNGWKMLNAGAMEWFAIVLGAGLVGVFAWVFFFVGSTRHDAAFQMQMLQLLLVVFAVMTAVTLYTACMLTTRWNDARIEQTSFGFGTRSIGFSEIRRLSPIHWANVLRIEGSDGTRIYVPLYQNGAPALVRRLKEKLGIVDPDADDDEQDG